MNLHPMPAVRGTKIARLPWPPLVAATAGAWAIVGFAATRSAPELPVLAVAVAQLSLAAGSAYLLDDSAAPVTGVTPRSMWRRRVSVLLPGLAVLAVAWGAALSLVAGRAPATTYVSLSVETVTLVLASLAMAGLVARRGEDEPGTVVGPAMALAGFALLLIQPLLGVQIFVEPGEGLASRFAGWVIAGLAALGLLVATLRDPAASRVPISQLIRR